MLREQARKQEQERLIAKFGLAQYGELTSLTTLRFFDDIVTRITQLEQHAAHCDAAHGRES